MICQTPIYVKKTKHNNAERIGVPCGKCSICKTNRRNEWTIRLQEERKMHKVASFLTLTYNDKNLYFNEYGINSVNKRDVQLFFKRLRKKYKFRYYLVAEYGTKTYRPHYHAIMFGIGEKQTEDIRKAWKQGNIYIAEVNIKTIKYVAKYHVNKNIKPNYSDKPFVLMSRKPALGANYVEEMKRYHKGNIDRVYYQEYQFKKALPRYYKDKLYTKMEKQLIVKNIEKDDKTLDNIRNYEKSGRNYFRDHAQNLKAREKTFKEKLNQNNKL